MADVQALKDQMATIQNDIATLRTDIASEKVEVGNLLTGLGTTVQGLKDQIKALQDQLGNGGLVTQADLDGLSSTAAAIHTALADVDTAVKDISEPAPPAPAP